MLPFSILSFISVPFLGAFASPKPVLDDDEGKYP